MSELKKKYILVELWGENDSVNDDTTEPIDEFIENLPEKYRQLFYKNVTPTNSYITYFFSWDGNKEGWSTSNKADEIREEFISVVKESYENPHIYHIIT